MTDDTQAPAPYVAVVYFHGMGNQRRYEESSRLIDSIDSYLSNEFRERGKSRGYLAAIKPKIEPHRLKQDQTVTYIRTRFFESREQRFEDTREVRFYEVYWAPIMASTSSPRRVAMWILRRSLRPWQTLRTVWRERQRLRRAALADLEDRKHDWPEGTEERDFDKLLHSYCDFEGLSAIREYPKGDYEEFQKFLAQKNADHPETCKRQQALAAAWLRFYRKTELKNIFVISTILLALALTGGLLVWSALQLLQLLSGLSIIAEDNFVFSEFLRERLSPTGSTAAGLVVGVLLALGLGKFLTDYMGDVEAWSTYEETDEKHLKRQRVMDVGTDVLKHVLADDRCERAMLISHSLGTSVAHDTLLSVARDNRATNAQDPISGPVRLDKIRHFVTMGSPIDKINYFFESFRSVYHRYTRVIETLRGDISDAPFARNRHPYMHWVNFWDEADIISGGLQSPVGRTTLAQRVDNVHVANLHFPSPGGSHTAYFNHRTVISNIFEMTYLNSLNYADAPMREDGKGYDYEAMHIGPGDGFGLSRWFFALASALPWAGLVYLLLTLAGADAAAGFALWGLAGLAIALAGSWIVQKNRGHRLPI